MTRSDATEVVVQAMRRVVPRRIELSPATSLDRTGLDSLGLIEMMVHLETLAGLAFGEDVIRRVVTAPEYHPGMSIDAFATLLWGMVDGDLPAGPDGRDHRLQPKE